MGAGVPYAIAAKFAHPDRPVIASVGDGAMQMNNMSELITVKKYHERWPNQTFVVCVLNNEDLNQVTWEQRVMEGDPKAEMTRSGSEDRRRGAPAAAAHQVLAGKVIHDDGDEGRSR